MRWRARGDGDANWSGAAGTVEALREVKDAGEIALLRLACEAADAALADLVSAAGCGRAAPRRRSAASWSR